MPKEIKTTIALICLATIATMIVAVLSDSEIAQAAVLLLINGFIFLALFTIKFYSDKHDADLLKAEQIAKEQQEKQQLLNELAAAKKTINSQQNNDNEAVPVQIIPDDYVPRSVLPGYEISFTPQGNPNSLLTNFIKNSKKELYIAQYDLCENKVLVEEIISAKRRGIDVRILVDYEKNSSPPALELLKYIESSNIPVYRSTNYSSMQHQFMIADGSEIQFGNAFGIDKKSSNSLLVFKNATNMVDNYRNEFLRIANEPQHESIMCSDVGCSEGGIITWRNGTLGYHWQCSKNNPNNPLCKSCELLGDEEHLERLQKGKTLNVEQIGCDHKGESITWINKWSNQEKGQFNQFWSCSGRSKNDELCQRCGIKGNEENPQQSIQPRAGDKCPLCKTGVLKMRRDNLGKYVLGCGNYPNCKYPET